MLELGETPFFAAYYKSPIGLISVLSDEENVRAVSFGYLPGYEKEKPILSDTIEQLKEYFAGTRKTFTVPFITKGTPFQEKVWYQLLQIPYGETRSYADIAFEIDKSKAFRAVGMANNRNPIGIIIPCHRVIGKNGSLVGYAGGLQYKQKLLDFERRYR
jgi:methylated-DNA-[protein]-cysteine S-methyltransferase